MAKCPNCKKKIDKPRKAWKYGPFRVNAYQCTCGVTVNEYVKNGEKAFTLIQVKGKKGCQRV
jgi:uncharacterized phage-associated protein